MDFAAYARLADRVVALSKAAQYRRKPPKNPAGWEPPTAKRKSWKKPDGKSSAAESPHPDPILGHVTVFHGTTRSRAEQIQREGLRSHDGTFRPSWYMVAEDFDSAAHHAHSYASEADPPVVVELRIPTHAKGGRKAWDGWPTLWNPHTLDWKGASTRWWGLREQVPTGAVVSVRPVHTTR